MNDLEILNLINEIGYLLLKHGAEIYRVEESLKRMCEGLGFHDIEIFAIPSYFTLSLTLHDGKPYQSSRRSRINRFHLDHLYELNCLVRKISNQEINDFEKQKEIKKIKSQPLNFHLILIGYIVSAAMFCIFFGGGITEMIVSSGIGFILYYLIYIMEKLNINSIVRTLLSSIVLSTIAILCHKVHIIVNQQSVITGTLMLLVPGIAITNSLRDIIGGDYVSGLARMIEAILIAVSIAIGVGIMMMVLGGV